MSRSQLIPLLFSEEFRALDGLLGYQLAGDFLKIGSWILSYVMLGRNHTRLFILSEVLFSAAYVGLAMGFVGSDGAGGTRGALFAWIGMYAGYWLFLWAALKHTLRT